MSLHCSCTECDFETDDRQAAEAHEADTGHEVDFIGGCDDEDEQAATRYEIEFDGCARRPLPEFTDEAIERARIEAEQAAGRKLADDDRTGFPSFAVYQDGEWIGGG